MRRMLVAAAVVMAFVLAVERQTFDLATAGVTEGQAFDLATAGVPNSFAPTSAGASDVICFSLGMHCAVDCGEAWLNMWDLTQCAYDDDYDGTWDRYGPVEMIDTGWCWLNP